MRLDSNFEDTTKEWESTEEPVLQSTRISKVAVQPGAALLQLVDLGLQGEQILAVFRLCVPQVGGDGAVTALRDDTDGVAAHRGRDIGVHGIHLLQQIGRAHV